MAIATAKGHVAIPCALRRLRVTSFIMSGVITCVVDQHPRFHLDAEVVRNFGDTPVDIAWIVAEWPTASLPS
ncbi:MAG: hypothetical protein M1420_00875 [Actinobacteria bacterium]|nr:hypothetical protein [Actinomycetota bacterium]